MPSASRVCSLPCQEQSRKRSNGSGLHLCDAQQSASAGNNQLGAWQMIGAASAAGIAGGIAGNPAGAYPDPTALDVLQWPY
jgi:hypothetical protein